MFDEIDNIVSVTIEEGILEIDDHAFCCCTALETVIIPKTVMSIEEYAFAGCTSLNKVTVPCSAYIRNNIFKNSGSFDLTVTTGNYSSSVSESQILSRNTIIGNDMFREANISSVTIEEGVIEIGSRAFQCCEALKTISIPSTVTFIGDYAFGGCPSIESIIVSNYNTVYRSYGCNAILKKSNKDYSTLILGCKNTIIHNSVKTIGENAFYGLSDCLINIPESVTNICDGAFKSCKNVTFNYTKCENCFDNITGASDFRSCLENSNSKLVCAKCNGETSYVDNHDGTHTINKTCSMCNKIYLTDTKSCEYSNHVCKYCNHTQPTKTIKIKTGDKNYTYTYTGYTIPTYEDVNSELKLKHLKVTSYYYVDDAGKFVDIPESASIPVGVSTVFARCKTTSILWLTSSENSTYISNIFSYCLYKVFPALLGI